MAININQQIEPVILIKFKYQIQFGAFLRGHSGTPINPAPVLVWCEALSYFSLGGAQNDSGRFQRESVFGHAIYINMKALQMANKPLKYYPSEALKELCVQRV